MEREDWNRRYGATDLLWTATPNATLVAEVASLPPGRALDLACGEGRNAVWLAEQGWRVTGVDFSDVALEKAARMAEANGVAVEWVQADLRDHVPEPDAYDLVVVLYLHVAAQVRAALLGAASRALRRGGTLLVLGHDTSNLAGGYGGPPDPSILYTPWDVTADVGGLSIEKAERVIRTVTTDEGPRRAVDALVRAVRPVARPDAQGRS